MAVFLSRDRSAARDRAVDFLRDQALSGPDFSRRSEFYLLTKDLTRRDLVSVRDRAEASAVRAIREAALSGGPYCMPDSFEGSVREAVSLARGALDSWMVPWTRLAGRLDHEADSRLDDFSGGPREVEDIARGALMESPYRLYMDEVRGWVHDACVARGLDYMQVSEDLSIRILAERFREEHPHLVGENRDEFLLNARLSGTGLEFPPVPIRGGEDRVEAVRYVASQPFVRVCSGALLHYGLLRRTDRNAVNAAAWERLHPKAARKQEFQQKM